MPDPRIETYAALLVDRCINVQPGWQVLVSSSPLARPLVEEVVRRIARRGAYALTRLSFDSIGSIWLTEAPKELIAKPAPLREHELLNLDAMISIGAPENTREGAEVPPGRRILFGKAYRPASERIYNDAVPWVACEYPTPALAQDAGMSLSAYESFLYGACLIDWEEIGAKMRRYADRFDAADRVRIVGEGTDLNLSLKGRKATVDDGYKNMPGGEFFFGPVEDSAEGYITFGEFPAIRGGREVEGIRLVFSQGNVVEASARKNEEVLLEALNADAGARYIGELGIGCNPGITKYMKSTLFDEKIDGTVHLALGNSYPFTGGTNKSAIHWDIVKDLRNGGKIYLDGELVQDNGRWMI